MGENCVVTECEQNTARNMSEMTQRNAILKTKN